MYGIVHVTSLRRPAIQDVQHALRVNGAAFVDGITLATVRSLPSAIFGDALRYGGEDTLKVDENTLLTRRIMANGAQGALPVENRALAPHTDGYVHGDSMPDIIILFAQRASKRVHRIRSETLAHVDVDKQKHGSTRYSVSRHAR